jgi:hypothetical protein
MAGGRKGNDEALVTALAAGGSASAAAQLAKVSTRTVHRRLEDPAFRARVDEARAEMVSQAVGRLAAGGALAGDTLHELLAKSVPPATRLGASRAVLEYMLRGAEVDALTREQAELRREIEELKRGSSHHAAGVGEAPHGAGDGGAAERPAAGPAAPGAGGGPGDAGVAGRVAEAVDVLPLRPDLAIGDPPGG